MTKEEKIRQRFKRNIMVTMSDITLYNFCKEELKLCVVNQNTINAIIATSLSKNEDMKKMNARIIAYLYLSTNDYDSPQLLDKLERLVIKMDMSHYDISTFTYRNWDKIWELIFPVDELVDCNY